METVPFNFELIRARVADIRQSAGVLGDYAALPEEQFAESAERVRSARYALIVAVEAAAAICNHLCARKGRAVDSYPACFETLGELGIIDPSLGQRLSALARLRNILVHGYGRINDRRLHRNLRNGLGDLDAYLDAVNEHLKTSSGGTA